MIKNILKMMTAQDTKKTMENEKRREFLRKRAKKFTPFRKNGVNFKCLKNQKKIELILADLTQRWEEENPTVWGR
jgi:hypothetical protein